MPNVMIEVGRTYSQAQEHALMEAVHLALVQGFKIPMQDRTVRLIVHEPHRLQGSPRLAQPDRFTLISIDCFAGRSLDAKRALYAAIVLNLGELGIPPDHVKVLLREAPRENWGIAGGQAACDLELGFKVDV
jgi:phenylpyruvate tautomerase PptA (4-oxalocrotonate tautomerase family)